MLKIKHQLQTLITLSIASFLVLPAKSVSLLGRGGLNQSQSLSNPRSYTDAITARQVGDTITIRIVENIQAIKKAEYRTGSNTDSDLNFTLRQAGTTTSTLDPSANDISNSVTAIRLPVDYGRNVNKEISVDNQEIFTTLISALVMEIDPASGNMVVEGSRQILIEGQTKSLYVRGIVNPKDIDANNELPSYKLANAQIQIIGNGSLTKDRDGGIIQKILRKIF